jgi:hypothetical protein
MSSDFFLILLISPHKLTYSYVFLDSLSRKSTVTF